ncbi:MAG: hypothetical protein K9M51_03950 [Candidatus Gracilibacteria bacterium]|nr:hypothetical protein [Candidatus Gracilibacteria bacterium]
MAELDRKTRKNILENLISSVEKPREEGGMGIEKVNGIKAIIRKKVKELGKEGKIALVEGYNSLELRLRAELQKLQEQGKITGDPEELLLEFLERIKTALAEKGVSIKETEETFSHLDVRYPKHTHKYWERSGE